MPALAVLSGILSAMDGDPLRAGTILFLGLYLVIERVAPTERSVPWRWARNASVGGFCLLVLILAIRTLGSA